MRDPQKEWDTFLEGLNIGEASACYLVRCKTGGKVALANEFLLKKFTRGFLEMPPLTCLAPPSTNGAK